MSKNKNILSTLLWYLSIFLLIFVTSRIKRDIKLPELNINPEVDEINFHEDFYRVVNLGQKRMISSLLWTHTLLFGDLNHIEDKKSFSWMYYRFKGISLIDPRFYENYFLGGQYLGVVKDDVKGSNFIFNKGLLVFPNDIELNFNLGFNYLFYEKNVERGIVLWKKILLDEKIATSKPLLPIRIQEFLNNQNDAKWGKRILEDLATKNIGTPIGDAYKKKLEILNSQP